MNIINYEDLRKLIQIDSPSGFSSEAGKFIHSYLNELGWNPYFTEKKALRCTLGEEPPTLAIAAHFDTLGAIVSTILPNGNLRFSVIGSPSLNSIDGEYVRIHTLSGTVFTGTVQLDNPAKHANAHLSSIERKTDNMHIVLDEEVGSAQEVKELGIGHGDIVAFETNYGEMPNGFIKSRFLDNKAGCLVLFELAKRISKLNAQFPVELFFSNYEEVGHGGTSGYSPTIRELLVIDMGVIGDGLDGHETKCSICAKDSSGPYDYNFRKKLTKLAQQNRIPHAVDIYPFYGSDGSAALRAGNDFRVALIGPGVSASHGKERTHKKGIEATIDLCMLYIEEMFKS